MKPFLNTCITLMALVGAPSLAIAQTVHMIGDSTMANKTADVYPETGWGQVLQRFASNSISIANHAANGRSSKSFISEGHWESVKTRLKPGDFVVIQFGHNDSKNQDPARYSEPHSEYKNNLQLFIADARAQGANPILLTSICRRRFDDEGELELTHGDYPGAVREVAADLEVPLIDMQRLTENLLRNYGEDASRGLYLHAPPGQLSNYPQGVVDDTHLSERGALEVADLFVEGLRDTGNPLARHFLNSALVGK